MRLSRRVSVTAALAALLAVAAPQHARADTTMTSDRLFGYQVAATPRQQPVTQVSAVWTIEPATRREAGDEAVWAWVAIGGGCVTYDCLVHDYTALRVGTETYVSPAGAVTYRAWYQDTVRRERAYLPVTVAAGDRVRGTVEQVRGLPALWRFTFDNVTTGATWTTTAPGASMLATAQVLAEGMVGFDEFAIGYPYLPDLAPTTFDHVTINGANARLRPEERVVMQSYEELAVVATPSLPQPDGNGFAACVWTTSCAVPADL